ncbi:MAG: HAD family phosphatase [bacterium]|nr:HAD family phosphatase [bacterium]
MIRAVIFDLDGLLADTESLHRQSYQEILRRYGCEPSDEEYLDYWIRSGKGAKYWIRKHNLDVDLSELQQQKHRRYMELVRSSAQAMKGASELLQKLSGKKKLALASASFRDSVHGVIEVLDMARYFEVVVTKNDVPRSKPFPDIFLRAVEELHMEADECVVLEDSERGVLAAHRAGLKCIAVPNEHTQHHDFSTAAIILASLEEVSIDLLE